MSEKTITVEDTYIETNSQYKNGAGLSEYNGTFSIASAYENGEGKKSIQWVHPTTKEGASEKVIPNQVRLGDITQAKEILRKYLSILEGGDVNAGEATDTPF